jgi:hypothetical protein
MSPDDILLMISFLLSFVLRLLSDQQDLHFLLMTVIGEEIDARFNSAHDWRLVNLRLNSDIGLVSSHMVQVFCTCFTVWFICYHLF